jgi:DNA-binding MarR family transcriptional regulator
MSVQAMTWAWSLDLPPTEKFVLVTLADHASIDTATCWPGLNRMAELTGFSTSGVRKALRRLTDKGLIQTHGRWRADGGRSSNTYIISLPEQAEVTRSTPPPLPSGPEGPLDEVQGPSEPLILNPHLEEEEAPRARTSEGSEAGHLPEWAQLLTERLPAFEQKPLSTSEVKEIQDDYMSVDLLAQARVFAAYHREKKSPTVRGRVRALHNWLSRSEPEPPDGMPTDWDGSLIGANR